MEKADVRTTALEAGKVLDTLAALSVDLACHFDKSPGQLVLTSARLREACAAIDDAVSSLKRILSITEANGGPVIKDSAVGKPRKP